MILLERETKMSEMMSPGGRAGAEMLGPGAVLGIKDTSLVYEFFGAIPNALGRKIDPKDAHVTLVDSFDTRIDSKPSNKGLLEHTVERMSNKLEEVPVGELVLHPSANQLTKFGAFMVIIIERNKVLQEIRDSLAEVVYNELGILLDDEEFTPHVSVAKLYRRHYKPKQFTPPIPEDMHVNSASVSVRSYSQDTNKARSNRNKFNNVPINRRS